MHTRNHASCRVQDTMSLGCPDFFTKPLTIAVIPQDPSLPATLPRRPMVKLAKKSEKHEPIDSATLKTMDTKQAIDKTSRDVKQQALFMKKKDAAPLSYLMKSMTINGAFSMGSMQADFCVFVVT